MPGAHTSTPQDVERALKRLSSDQFAQVCGEVGILEVTLPGGTQSGKAAALVQRTQGHADFAVLARAITRADPNAWRPAPARMSIPSAVYGLLALIAIVGIGGLALALILGGIEPAAAPTATPTETIAPTRTPVPTFTYTPTDTPIPSPTLTPTKTATNTPEPVTLAPVVSTDTPAPVVSIIYQQVELQLPPPNHRAYPSETVEFRWILRGVTLAADERFWMRLYLDGAVVDSYLTPDAWRYYTVPPGANGSFDWTVTVVKVDAAGGILGPLSPESGQRTVVWQP